MLRSTAGSRLYISSTGFRSGSAPVGPAALFTALSWIRIGWMEGMGSLGFQWSTIPVGHSGDDRIDRVVKGRRSGNVMQISMGLDDGDAGQLKLVEAAGGHHDFAFWLLFPDDPLGLQPTPTRMWIASVTSLTEAYDTASNVVKRVADLATNSAVWPVLGRAP